MGLFDSIFGGSGGDSSSHPSTSASQRALEKKISEWLMGNIGEGAQPYAGQLTADIPQMFLDAYQEFGEQPYGDLTQQATIDLMSGKPAYAFEPGQAVSDWKEMYATPMMETWQATVLPMVREGYNYPGGAFSRQAMQGTEKAGSEFYGQYVAPKLYESLMTGKQMEFQSGEAAAARRQGALDIPFQQYSQQAGAGMQMMGLEQNALNAQYQEFLRTRAEPGWAATAGMGYMNQPTWDTAVQQEGPSPFSQASGFATTALMIAMLASDVALKTDVKSISGALDKLKHLDGKTFKFIGGAKSGGVIAQDVEKVMPDAVGEFNGLKAVDYTALIGLLISAVNELARKVGD